MSYRPRLIAVSLVVVLLLAACGDADSDGFLIGPDPTTMPTGTPTALPTTAPAADGGQVDGDAATIAVLEPRDGVWQIGDAGEIEFSAQAGGLQLLSVRPANGWTVASQKAEPDKIEVTFERRDAKWEIEVELDDGMLEVEIDHEDKRAEPGSLSVGIPGLADAGSIDVAVERNALNLAGLTLNEGWSHEIEESSRSTIKATFDRDHARWKLEAKRSGRGIELKLELKMAGPIVG